MLAHNTKRSNTFSGAYLLFSGAVVMLLMAVLILFLFNTERTNADTQNSFTTYQSSQNRYSISYPADWQLGAGDARSNVTTISSMISRNEQEGGLIDPRKYRNQPEELVAAFSKIDVLTYSVEKGTTPLQVLSSRTNFGINGVASEIKIGNLSAIRLDVDIAEATAGQKLSKIYTSVYIISGDMGYIIAGFASPEVLDKIIYSFKVW
jgi:hypothetical protein